MLLQAMSARGFNTSAGKVYIYSNGGTDGAQFTLHQIVTSGNAHAADFFGASVSIKNGPFSFSLPKKLGSRNCITF